MSFQNMEFFNLNGLSGDQVQLIKRILKEPSDIFWSEREERNIEEVIPEEEYASKANNRTQTNRDRKFNNKNFNKQNYQKSYRTNNSYNGSNGDYIVDGMQNLIIETNNVQQQAHSVGAHHQQQQQQPSQPPHPPVSNTAMNINVAYNQGSRNGLPVYGPQQSAQAGAQPLVYSNSAYSMTFTPNMVTNASSFIMNSPTAACDSKRDFNYPHNQYQHQNFTQTGHGARLQQHAPQSQEYHPYTQVPFPSYMVSYSPNSPFYSFSPYQQQHHPHHPQQMNAADSNYGQQRYAFVFSPPNSGHMVYAQTNIVDNYPQDHQQLAADTPPPSNVSSSPLTINSNQIENDTTPDSPSSITPVNNKDTNDVDKIDVEHHPSEQCKDVGSFNVDVDAIQTQIQEYKPPSENGIESSFNGDDFLNDEPNSEPLNETEQIPVAKTEVSWASIASKKMPAKPSISIANNQPVKSSKSRTVSEQGDSNASNHTHSPTPASSTVSPVATVTQIETVKTEKKSKKSKKNDALNNVTRIKVEDDGFAIKIVERVKNYKLIHAYPAIVPSGFINRGNYCYINAVLQSLLASPPFYNLMRDLGCSLYGISRPESCTPILDSFVRLFAHFPPSHDLRSKLKNAQQSNTLNSYLEGLLNNSFEPLLIRQALKFIGMTNEQGLQEDAEEFFSNVLNGMNDEFIAMGKYFETRNNPDSFENNLNHDKGSDDNLWKEVGTRKQNKTLLTRTPSVVSTPIADIFQGFTLDIRTIANQPKEPIMGNRQPFFSFQVDIKAPSIKTLDDALRHRTQPETIDGYICSQTKQNIQASSQTFLEVLPPILVLHLKLFDYDSSTNSSSKVLKRVQFEESFEIPKECLSRNHRGTRKYKLLAVVSHSGTEAQKGHYITEAYHVGLNKWLRCDDSNVKVTDLNHVLNGGETNLVPYLLFYRRYDTIAREGEQFGQRNNTEAASNAFAALNRYSRN